MCLDLRRSGRTRIRPVSYWTGERVIYEVGPDSCQQVVGIRPGHKDFIKTDHGNKLLYTFIKI